MEIIEKIKSYMNQRGWSQKELARRAGLPQSTVNSMFRRGKAPSLPVLQDICRAFEITLRDFLCDNETPATLTREQLELFDKWSACTPEQKELLSKLIDQFK